MVAPGMRRYRQRTAAQAELIGQCGTTRLDPATLFDRTAPLRLEIGCGHGEFISQLAAAHPDEDILGVEYDALRVTKCAHKCLRAGARNVRLFAAEAHAFVRDRLPDACACRIYVLFPDPWPKLAHRRRRLMNRAFLAELARVAAPDCRLIIASDHANYAMSMLSQISTLPGLWRNLLPGGFAVDLPVRFETVFERHKRAEGERICHLRFARTHRPN